jgi:hypothetical protein
MKMSKFQETTLNEKLEKWLKHNSFWNKKRTKATCSLFSVPQELLCSVKKEVGSIIVAQVNRSLLEDRGKTCRACNLSFTQTEEQQQHFKTELHRINLKRNLNGLAPIANIDEVIDTNIKRREVSFANEIKNDENDSSEDEEEDIFTAMDYLEDELNGNNDKPFSKTLPEYHSENGPARKYFSKSDGPQYLFSPSKEPLWDFSLSVAALHSTSDVDIFEVKPWNLLSDTIQSIQDKSGTMWCVLILRSGRFAGAIFDGQTMLVSKVLRRYTIRAKSGGSQSSYDNQGIFIFLYDIFIVYKIRIMYTCDPVMKSSLRDSHVIKSSLCDSHVMKSSLRDILV